PAHRSWAGLRRDPQRDGLDPGQGEERNPSGTAGAEVAPGEVCRRTSRMKCDPDLLEALVAGGMGPEEASAVEAHAAQCGSCGGGRGKGRRAERGRWRGGAGGAPPPPQKLDQLWSGVEARLHERPPARAWWRPLGFSTAVAAAAVLAFLAGRQAAERARQPAP